MVFVATGDSKIWPPKHLNVVSHSSENERQLAAEVEDLKHIHALSLRLAGTQTLSDVLLDVLRTAAGLVEAPLGSVQLVTPERTLGMIGQIGFGDAIVDQFSTVRLEDCSTCAVALQKRARVIVHNLRTDPNFTEIAAALRSYGAVAAISTPVLDSGGNVLAMFSIYWRQEHEPSDRELRALDLCAELAGRHLERKSAEARQALLMRELAHRGRNLISVIQAIANRSLSGERTLAEARPVFIGRLQALGNTYNTFTEETPESAYLHDIVTAGLRSHGEQTNISGPAVVVSAKAAQTLSLIIHELATNAAKYGALSVPAGHIELSWELTRDDSDQERFQFKWSEHGGPPVTPPKHKGFGFAIITSMAAGELKCAPTAEYATHGFRYKLECSSRALTDV